MRKWSDSNTKELREKILEKFGERLLMIHYNDGIVIKSLLYDNLPENVALWIKQHTLYSGFAYNGNCVIVYF